MELEEVTEKLQSVSDNTEQFIKTIKSFTDFSILTTSMINQLIDRIVIFQKQKLKRYKFTQRIDIYFSFIGKFEIEKECEIKETEYIEETEDKKYIHKDSRFSPITNYLKEQGREVELEFSKVEELIGRKLCKSARKYPGYWYASGNRPMGNAIYNAGYDIVKVDVKKETIKLINYDK